ncbi:MAG TPA: inositol monophosphatase family protein [Saprospiraceae bacterium]|nr:inositol monophosphatase family protein [Saprospiraceae bacterium]
MDSFQLEIICTQAAGQIKQAARFIREELGKVHSEHIQEKEKHSLVSYVDIETEKTLVKSLSALVPDCNFITEEGTQLPTTKGRYNWIIDPLDGTTNFLKGIPVFSISVALAKDDELLIGIVYDVMQDECFYSWKNGGAYCNGKRIAVSEVNGLEEAVIATGFPYQRKWMDNLASILTEVLQRCRGVRRLGSAAIDLAYTACGRFDGYYETRLNAWDMAAGILLIREAGGRVTNFKAEVGGILASHHILATNGKIHDELQAICRTTILDE